MILRVVSILGLHVCDYESLSTSLVKGRQEKQCLATVLCGLQDLRRKVSSEIALLLQGIESSKGE